MAYWQQTPEGQALYRECKSTIEPVIGIIKAILGFRHFSLRGLEKVVGEWRLVCTAYNLKRLLSLRASKAMKQAQVLAKPAPRAVQTIELPCFPKGNQLYRLERWIYRRITALTTLSKATVRRRWVTGC